MLLLVSDAVGVEVHDLVPNAPTVNLVLSLNKPHNANKALAFGSRHVMKCNLHKRWLCVTVELKSKQCWNEHDLFNSS